MWNRKDPREKKNFQVVLRDGDTTHNAIVTDISRTGMSIKIGHVFPTYKVIDVLVKIKGQPVQLKASVRWINECGVEGEAKLYEIGLLLPNPPPEYTRNFDKRQQTEKPG